MGILDFIFGKTHKIEDPFFGKMTFMEIKKNPDQSYFECARHFKPTDQQIEIGIEADPTGPVDKQKDFYRQIESEYEIIVEEVTPLIVSEFRNFKEDFRIKNFQKEFKAVYLFLPRCDTENKIWEIAFETIHDLNHQITVTLKDFKATEIVIDGQNKNSTGANSAYSLWRDYRKFGL